MKKLLYVFLLILCYACEEDKSIDPTLMPEATTTGENTLGCLIDGWVYTAGRFGSPEVRVRNDEENHYIDIEAQIDRFSDLHFTLVNPQQGATCTYTNVVFDQERLPDGEAHITRMDGSVISGTFSGGNIREGRFDIRYQGESEGDGGNVVY
ncbi:hypothetical protein [Bacteroides sp. UBA939]|uniref:hypothetical protein n=1 Tax=Bacteroides sp. UBA939 TaxID=1946092 RepID=UPI0025B84EF8|nr:hypothetical protein [Bacteroides sp. UBA939]